MKKLLFLFYVLIFFVACSNDQSPKAIIPEDKMVNVLIDMHLTDAALDFSYNPDSLLINAKSRYQYLFKKHEIDSVRFSKSLTYYGKNLDILNNIYAQVTDSLQILSDNVTKEQNRKLRLPLKFIDSLNNLTLKSSLVNNKVKTDTTSVIDSFNNADVKNKVRSIEREVQKDSIIRPSKRALRKF